MFLSQFISFKTSTMQGVVFVIHSFYSPVHGFYYNLALKCVDMVFFFTVRIPTTTRLIERSSNDSIFLFFEHQPSWIEIERCSSDLFHLGFTTD